ncbi:MAG: PAS domain-containing protein [Gammaproteobacteria bacterium]|nr:PAS domain-containing protein [Gammaproteobacteria bacterium]MCP4090901.1 PAS domain-containing protein [Gammaproteobacteria bacterium]MCP4275188.1 PAS domain-containing protein [Gammaproteobacteria bacterium]MCP4929591.1 PAS domain-containing protein [Gammaproteobacteria bacterium]
MVASLEGKVTDKLLNELTTCVVLLDLEGVVTYMNAAAEDVLGISARRVVGTRLINSLPGFAEIDELCIRAVQERQSFGHALCVPAPQRDSSDRELAVRATPLDSEQNEKGQSNALLLELFDITQRNHLDRENTLVAQHGVSRRMLQQLAHEIRNPLGGLRGAAQLLERELNNIDQREYTQVIIREADRLACLMDGLLGPGSQPSTMIINVHEVLEHISTIIESESANVHIRRDYDPSLPDLALDRDQMTQALLNLVRNAAQAIEGHGQIILRTRVLTNTILNKAKHKLVACIEVQDNGPGVSEDIADTLFYPLVTSRDTGTGLGLPLAQDLVNRHGGLIEYDSAPGYTVFTVLLPIEEIEKTTGNRR